MRLNWQATAQTTAGVTGLNIPAINGDTTAL